MKLTKKRGGIITAAVVATGLVAAGTTTAFADSPSTATGAHAAAKAGKGAEVRGRLGGLFLDGAHGQRTVKDKTGAWVAREWQVGKVASASGQAVTVTSGDGTTWTWTAASTTRVRADGQKSELSAVKAGDEVLVTGVKNGSANDADVVLDPSQAQIQKWESAHTKQAAKRAANKAARKSAPTTPSTGAPSSSTGGA